MLELTDDSGFLAVVVPASYPSFVARDCALDELFDHLRQEMQRRSLLVWATGLEGCWKVDVRVGESYIDGLREVSGPLRVVGGVVLVTNYESLTMAAQFEDVRLPEPHEVQQLVRLEDGDYSCRIVQRFDPCELHGAEDGAADFVIEFSHPSALPEPWSAVPWFGG